MNMDNNNNINKYNLQNRIKWRKIYFYKNNKLLGFDVWEILNNVLFNNNSSNSQLDLSRLFVSYLYF